jgi:acetyl esterase/lipase
MNPLFVISLLFISISLPVGNGADYDPYSQKLLGTTESQLEIFRKGAAEGLLELAPVHLPVDPPGDCNHYGWPIATMSGDTMVVMHRRIPGHKKTGSGGPDEKMSYGVVLRSIDGGETWSEPYDLRDCMAPEDRDRGGIVPLSHRAKFDVKNKSPRGYKVHLHAIGTARDGAIVAVNNHGVFRSEDRGRTWRHFPTALREDTFNHPIINIGPRIVDHPDHGLMVFGNWFGEVSQYHKYSEKLVALTSPDGGESWQVEEHEVGFRQYEPAALLHDNEFKFVTRDQNQVRSHRQLTWLPKQTPKVSETNLQDPRLVDTVDLSFNPVTKRLEIVRSERHRMQLWLWSMDPAEWRRGHWRRECRLFVRGGSFYREADGFHPAGAVIDEERGVQHVFVYVGHPNGPAGVFRITRTLDTPALVRHLNHAPAVQIEDAGKFAVHRGLVYSRPENEKELTLDLFVPSVTEKKPVPCVIVIQGGGFSAQNGQRFRPFAEYLAGHGFAAALISYRGRPDHRYLETMADLKAAVRFVRRISGGYGIDPERIGATGRSAGGTLAALLGVTSGIKEFEGAGGHADYSSRIQAAVPIAGVFDFVARFTDAEQLKLQPRFRTKIKTNGEWIGAPFAAADRHWLGSSAVTHVDATDPPMLFIHCRDDGTVPWLQSRDMHRRLIKAGVSSTLQIYETGGHGFRDRGETTMKDMVDFFSAALAPKIRR